MKYLISIYPPMKNTKFDEIVSLQYMGSKSRILSDVCEAILSYPECEEIVDLFAGSGTIGYALKGRKKVTSNDIEYYSYLLNKALLNGCLFAKDDEARFFESANLCLERILNKVEDEAALESNLLKSNDCDSYRVYCETTPSVFQLIGSRNSSLYELCKKIHMGYKEQTSIDFPCLFLSYFSNSYFGLRQCAEIDALRWAISMERDERVRCVLLAALMTSMSSCASTTTHFAQFLKVTSRSAFNNLAEKRKQSVFTLLERNLVEYRRAGLLDSDKDVAACFNLDYLECLKGLNLNGRFVVYADPPYFKEHYSRYYHVLNTLCFYDYPECSLNPLTHEYSIGRYRANRNVSDFGRKAKALDAFRHLVVCCSEKGAKLVISYSDNSIVKIEDIIGLAKEKYAEVSVREVNLSHSKQGRKSTSKVNEYIILCGATNGR